MRIDNCKIEKSFFSSISKSLTLPSHPSKMTSGRQRDHKVGLTERRVRQWRSIFMYAIRRRLHGIQSAVTSTESITSIMQRMAQEEKERGLQLARRNRIGLSQFSFNFNSLTENDTLLQFRFRKVDVMRMIDAVSWPPFKSHTCRNRFAVTPLLATCIILRRLSSPARWKDLEMLFGKHSSQLSEIFWEGLEHMLHDRLHLITGPINQEFMIEKAPIYAQSVYEKCQALTNCVGFIDGTVIGISRPKGNAMQKVAYNGHKRKHALKFQAVNTPDGLIMHVYGPIEGRRHDWTMYTRSGLDEHLPDLLGINGVQYCLFGDSGYNRRWFMEVPFQGSNISPNQIAFNKAMSAARITVEWIFKEVKLYFTAVDFKRKMKVFESPVGSLYLAAMLLSNMRNCVYRNQISKYFKCLPPTLEEYLIHKD